MTRSSSSRTSSGTTSATPTSCSPSCCSVKEVATAVSASTVTTVAVFLPIAFVGDMTGELFRPFALTVTIAMVASLFVSLTIVPVLAYWFLRPGKPILDAAGAAIDPRGPGGPAVAPAEVVPADPALDPQALRRDDRARRARAGGDDRPRAADEDELPRRLRAEHLHDDPEPRTRARASRRRTPPPPRSRPCSQDIEGIETVQLSIGSSGSALRDAFTGGGSGITYSISTSEDADQVALREDVQEAVADLEDAGTFTVAGGGGFAGSSDVEINVSAPDRESLEVATQDVVDSPRRGRRRRPGVQQPERRPALHRGRRRQRRRCAARPQRGRRRRDRLELDAAPVDRHGRDRRDLPHRVPGRIPGARDARRAAPAADPLGHRADPARADRRRSRRPWARHPSPPSAVSGSRPSP